MKVMLSTICLTVFVLFSFSHAFANVVLPGTNGTFEVLSFLPSALEELEAEENSFFSMMRVLYMAL